MRKLTQKENDFIIALLRAFLGSGARSKTPKTDLAGLDWGLLAKTAEDHRILPFIALALRKSGALRRLPAELQTLMQSRLQSAAWENLVKMKEFEKVSRLLERERIRVVPLKGIALTHLVYRKNPVRRMGDLDLLLRPAEVERTAKLLTSLGFKAPMSANAWQDRIFNNGRKSFVKDGLDIDLQWAPKFLIAKHYVAWDSQNAWENSRPCPSLGGNVGMLSPLDQARYLLLQASDDLDRNYFFLYQLMDLAAVMKKYALSEESILEGLDFPDAAPRAFAKNLLRFAGACFLGEKSWAGLPPGQKKIWESLFRQRSRPEDNPLGRAALKAIPSRLDRLVFLAGYLFPDKDYVRGKYGSGLKASVRGHLGHWTRLYRKARRSL